MRIGGLPRSLSVRRRRRSGLLCLLVLSCHLAPRNARAQALVSGKVTLPSVVNSVQPITFAFCENYGTTFTRNTTLDASGNYSLNNIPAGTYTLGVKGYKWLRKN